MPERDDPAFAARGDATPYVEALYARRGQVLWGYARRLGLTDGEASDAVQEAVLRLLAYLGSGRRIEDPEAWIFTVLHRLCMDEHRSSRRLRELEARVRVLRGAANAPDPDVRIAVWAEVDALPARQRAVLYLRYRADLTFEQIGAVLGISPAGARAQASRALATVRKRLTGSDDT